MIICNYCNTKIKDNSDNCPYCLNVINMDNSNENKLHNLIDSILSKSIIEQILSSTKPKKSSSYIIGLVFTLTLIALFFPILLNLIL